MDLINYLDTKEEGIGLSNGKNSLYVSSALIALIITQVTIRSIGIENISAQVCVTLLVIACTLAIVGIFKNRTKGLGIRYNTILIILMILTSASSGIWITIIKNYPQLLNKYNKILFTASLGSFLAFTIFIIAGRIVYMIRSK